MTLMGCRANDDNDYDHDIRMGKGFKQSIAHISKIHCNMQALGCIYTPLFSKAYENGLFRSCGLLSTANMTKTNVLLYLIIT